MPPWSDGGNPPDEKSAIFLIVSILCLQVSFWVETGYPSKKVAKALEEQNGQRGEEISGSIMHGYMEFSLAFEEHCKMHIRTVHVRDARWITNPLTSVSHWSRTAPQFLILSYFHNYTSKHVLEQTAGDTQWGQG